MCGCLRLVLPLTGRFSREPLVVIVRPALRNPATTDINDVTKAMLLVMDLLLEEDETVVIRGLEVVLDSSAMTWQHAAQMNPSVIKKAAVIMQVIARPVSLYCQEGKERGLLICRVEMGDRALINVGLGRR